MNDRSQTTVKLTKSIRELLWEYDKRSVSWPEDADLIIRKVLHSGTWDDIQWLRRTLGDPQLRNWLLERQGAGLDARRIRFWQLALELPEDRVREWLERNRQNPWQQRWHQ